MTATGTTTGLIRARIERGARGLVIEGSGWAATCRRPVLPGLRRRWPPASRCGARLRCCGEGTVMPTYGYEGGGQKLREMGLIFGGDLTGPKARIKLMVALGVASEASDIRPWFESPDLDGGL